MVADSWQILTLTRVGEIIREMQLFGVTVIGHLREFGGWMDEGGIVKPFRVSFFWEKGNSCGHQTYSSWLDNSIYLRQVRDFVFIFCLTDRFPLSPPDCYQCPVIRLWAVVGSDGRPFLIAHHKPIKPNWPSPTRQQNKLQITSTMSTRRTFRRQIQGTGSSTMLTLKYIESVPFVS